MMKSNKKIFKFLIIIIFVFFVFLTIITSISKLNKIDYIKAKNQCEEILDNDIYQMTKLSNEYLNNKILDVNEYKKFEIIYHNKEWILGNDMEYVEFKINQQGMLGGQYWGLLYIPSNEYLGESELYIYNEKNVKNSGNNIFVRKKLKDNWFFYYDDFDGIVDLKTIK